MPGRDTKEPRGKSAVMVSLADAKRALARAQRHIDDPPPMMPRTDRDGEEIAPQKWPASPPNWTKNNLGLPNEQPCPVEPLGIEGAIRHLIDSDGQFQSLTPRDFSHSGMQSLFAAAPNYPQFFWPRFGKTKTDNEGKPLPPPIMSFQDDNVRSALFLACSRMGTFSPRDKLRGLGAWTLRGGQIAYHAGEEVWVCENGRLTWREPGMIGEHLYPRMAPIPAPWPEPIPPRDNPAGALLATYRRWNWERPDVDPVLLLGHNVVSYLGAALRWRSAVMLLGGASTGKSTLQRGLKDLFGETLVQANNASAAAIYQNMRADSRPVAVDELEPGANQARVDAMIELMRGASSGGFTLRGGQDGTPKTYQMQSAFLFSAINNPLHSMQDFGRVAMLRLQTIADDAPAPPPVDPDTLGRKLLAIAMREWGRFPAVLEAYRGALAAGGHNGRGQDTYGTLLACADLVLADIADQAGVRLSEDLRWWSEHLSVEELPETEDIKANWRDCLERILTARVAAWRNGARESVGQCLADVVAAAPAKADGNVSYDYLAAKRDLALTGLGLLKADELLGDYVKLKNCTLDEAKDALGLGGREGYILAIPHASPRIAELLVDTAWRAGGWRDALRQCPVAGVMITKKDVNRQWIAGVQARCTLVVMSRFHGAPER